MKKRTEYFLGLLIAVFFIFNTKCDVYASDDGQEYITISVDASDTSGQLQYALDTDTPDAFSYSNEFSVPAGSSHTIYVKDAAGNISSQEFSPSITTTTVAETSTEERERTVNIDVTLGNDKPDTNDSIKGNLSPAEAGQGTLYNQVTTSGNNENAKKIFYTVTTKDGEVFYLIIDQTANGNDNVYLLDQVKLSDLNSLAKDDSGKLETQGTTSLLDALGGTSTEQEESLSVTEAEKPSSKSNTTRNGLIVIALAAIVGGVYYYLKIYKNKKDEQMDLVDAMDKDDFALEEEDDGEEVDFGLDDDYQEKVMNELLSEDDIPEDTDDEESTDSDEISDVETDHSSYATSHNNDEPVIAEGEYEEFDEELDAPDEED